MDPVYRNMQSYPYQKDEIRYGPHYYPGAEAIPTQMHVPRPPMSHSCWPWGGNYGYGSPMGCHGCCNNAYMPPHYAWGSPYSHVPPHHYPSFPVHYMPPPSFYDPWFEYGKNVAVDHHCCGCPNHPCHQKEQKNVRIEEEEPERERRKDDSVVPFKFKNSPYPIAWIPPDFSGNKGQPNTKDGSYDANVNENKKIGEQQPSFWYPLDLNNLVSSRQRGDGEESHQQVDYKPNSPFPVFWIPYKPEENEIEKHKVKDVDTKPSLESEKAYERDRNEETASRAKDIPVKEVEYGVKKSSIDQAASRVKDIPVKEVENVEKKSSINQEITRDDSARVDNDAEKLDRGEKMSCKDGSKRKSSSPAKSSKLPPVCLRVDPLPRRKSTNGKSRSPSPPGDKPKPTLESNEPSKVASSLDNKENVGEESLVKLPAKFQDEVSVNQVEEKPKEGHLSQENAENGALINDQSEDAGSARDVEADEVKKYIKRELSEEAAAVIIQSGYRGFNIRRWEPVKKLKQIAKVRQQIADVKHLIEALELSSDNQGRSKQRNVIAETIMSLLLKLDMIQGLHPSIREVRKAVVKELVSLQEKLDSLVNEKSEDSSGGISMMRCEEDSLNKSEDDISSETSPTEILEAHQNTTNGGSESSEAGVTGYEVSEKMEKEAAESSTVNGADSVPEPTIKYEGEKSSGVTENGGTSFDKKGDHEGLVIEQSSEHSSAVEGEFAATACDKIGSGSVEPTIKEVDEKSSGVTENNETSIAQRDDHEGLAIERCSEYLSAGVREVAPAEVPHGVLDDSCAQEGPNHALVEADISKACESKQQPVESIELPPTSESHNDTTNSEDNKTVEIHEVFGGAIVESETKETALIGGTEEVAGRQTADGVFEPDECTAEPQPQPEFIVDMFEPPKASDDKVLPASEACICNYSNDADENSGVADSNESLKSEESSLDTPSGKEMSNQSIQEGNLDHKTSLISVSTNTYDAADMIGVEGVAKAKPNDNEGIGSDNCIVAEINSSEEASKEMQFQITEIKGPVDVGQGQEQGRNTNYQNAVDPTTHARDELAESNRKLMEENEKLRDMMQNMIKSGQEQLTAISSLSGRVKDLERKLCKKRKLKIKQNRAPRSGLSCVKNSDGSTQVRVM